MIQASSSLGGLGQFGSWRARQIWAWQADLGPRGSGKFGPGSSLRVLASWDLAGLGETWQVWVLASLGPGGLGEFKFWFEGLVSVLTGHVKDWDCRI